MRNGCVSLILLAFASMAAAAEPRKPNVILILADELGRWGQGDFPFLGV